MRVLVIEDEHKIANSVKKGLEQENFAVDVAYNGNGGFDLASTESYDTIILDLLLPGKTGLAICKDLRKEGNHTPILMLTARGELSDKVEGLNSGADDYLVKPFAFAELLARVKALTRRPPDNFVAKLEMGDLTLDPATYEVKKGGRPVSLSRKEFALLEYLLRHKGSVVTKEQIIQSVWDYEADILPNTVEVFVGYLRNKIGKGVIKTVRGFGYKIG